MTIREIPISKIIPVQDVEGNILMPICVQSHGGMIEFTTKMDKEAALELAQNLIKLAEAK